MEEAELQQATTAASGLAPEHCRERYTYCKPASEQYVDKEEEDEDHNEDMQNMNKMNDYN